VIGEPHVTGIPFFRTSFRGQRVAPDYFFLPTISFFVAQSKHIPQN